MSAPLRRVRVTPSRTGHWRVVEQQWVATAYGGLEVLELREVQVREPGPGEVTVRVHAAGMNPADAKHVAPGPRNDPAALPVPIGYELSGVVEALGPDTELGSGPASVGDEVLAFRTAGSYATALTLPARDVFAKPATLSHPEAANLLLAGTTAAEALHVTGARSGETLLLHGASGAVGVSLLQQARLLGVRVVGTAGGHSAAVVERFGGVPVAYGDGLLGRARALAPEGFAAAVDAVGTDEALDVSIALVADRQRIVTVVSPQRAEADGLRWIAGALPGSAAFRDAARGRLVRMAADGQLVVPVARTFPLAQAREALELLLGGHPGGKLALVP